MMRDFKYSAMDKDTSGFISSYGDMRIDVGGLMSERYSNITEIYGSDASHFKLYSAIRYGKRYVLKGLSKKYADDPLYQALLAKEFELGINLDHPNIRRTIGFENIEGVGNAIALEYVDGETLESALMSGRLNAQQVRSVLEQTADALDYLNRRQILHRDIKPSNIILTYSGCQVKIIDFSHADADAYIMLKSAAGTESYIAPELVDGLGAPSIKTDIYSFGMVAKAIADTLDDDYAARIAEICCNRNPDLRPASFSGIAQASKSTVGGRIRMLFESKKLTIVLAVVLIAIWSYIIYLI